MDNINFEFEKVNIDDLLDDVEFMEDFGQLDIRILEALPGHIETRIDPIFKDKPSHMSSIRDYIRSLRKAVEIIKGSHEDDDLFEPYMEIVYTLLKLLRWEYIQKDSIPSIKSIARIILNKNIEIVD